MTDSPIMDLSIYSFLNTLASDSPTPGGGSVAALSGAMGAALVSMVCRLTIGRKKYAAVEAEMQTVLAKAETLRARLSELVSEDVDAFNQVMAAYGLPRQSEEEKALRATAIQRALVEATRIPMATADACAQVIRLCETTALLGNLSAVSDAGAAAAVALAGVRSAVLNVLINLSNLNDPMFVTKNRQSIETLLADSAEMAERVYRIVIERMEVGG